MTMVLKYQSLIDQENLTIPCPDKHLSTVRRESYRWCNSPISHTYNFLPNRYADELMGKKRRKLKGDTECCEYCALSFFNTHINAKDRYTGFPERTQEMLGYTHIACGTVEDSDGLTSDPDEYGHFNFYEFSTITVPLQDKFLIIDSF